MPIYESYTNESDTLFAQQLDSMKLSETAVDPTHSSLGANVAISNLGYDRELGLDMASKQRMHAASMLTRQSISADRSKAVEAGELKDAMSEFSESFTGDPVQDALTMQQIGSKYPWNPEIQRAFEGQDKASARIAQAKSNAFKRKQEEYQEDVWDATEGARMEIDLNEAESTRIQTSERLKSIQMMEGAPEESVRQIRINTAGEIGDLDPELGDIFATIYQDEDLELGLGKPFMNKMDNLSQAIVQSKGLEASAKIGLRDHAKALGSLEQMGINLDEVSRDEAITQYLDKVSKQSGPMTLKAIDQIRTQLDKALSAREKMVEIGKVREEVVNTIKGIMPEDLANMTEEDKKAFKTKMAAMQWRIAKVNGSMAEINKEFAAENARKKMGLEFMKDEAQISATVERMEASKARRYMADKIFQAKQAQLDAGRIWKTVNALTPKMRDKVFKAYFEKQGVDLNKLGEYEGDLDNLLLGFVNEHRGGQSAYSQ